jgi:catechol 2,3-dioxygenase-like lactoylglutathione lyase family enzyme
MESRVPVITLAVTDLERALAFYREGLGLNSAGVIATEFIGDDENPAGDIARFHLDGNLILALDPRTELAKDAGIPFRTTKVGRVQHRATRREQAGRRRAARPGRGRGRDAHRVTA